MGAFDAQVSMFQIFHMISFPFIKMTVLGKESHYKGSTVTVTMLQKQSNRGNAFAFGSTFCADSTHFQKDLCTWCLCHPRVLPNAQMLPICGFEHKCLPLKRHYLGQGLNFFQHLE